jgi:hypothetical protein
MLKTDKRFGGTCWLLIQGRIRVLRQATSKHEEEDMLNIYLYTTKIKAENSSETSVDFQLTTWHYGPLDRTLDVKYDFTS